MPKIPSPVKGVEEGKEEEFEDMRENSQILKRQKVSQVASAPFAASENVTQAPENDSKNEQEVKISEETLQNGQDDQNHGSVLKEKLTNGLHDPTKSNQESSSSVGSAPSRNGNSNGL